MAPDKVFVDANVIIEILESRPKQNQAMRALRQVSGRVYISTLTCHIIAYVCIKRSGLDVIEQILADFDKLSLEQNDVNWAFANRRNNDFEDALQLAVAIRNGCDTFLTFDQPLHKAYKDLPNITIELL